MRIGILTQPLHNNYGGLLQNYALQQVLVSLGHEVVTLDLHPANPSFLQWLSLRKKMLLSYIKNNVDKPRYELTDEEVKIIGKHTNRFVSKYIHVSTNTIHSLEDLEKIDKIGVYDTYVVGSDQVWRPSYNGEMLTAMFLSFVKRDAVRRIAYAASFGTSEWEFAPQMTEECARLAKQFDLITVREKSGVTLCREYLGVEAAHVLDPTMLLNSEDYEKVVGDENEPKSLGTLFHYILDPSEEKRSLIERLAVKQGLQAFTIMPKCQAENRTKWDVKHRIEDCVFPSVTSWLRGFMDAEMVIVDSFHGAVFSIIFNKPFWVIANAERGNARFDSLLGLFGLEDRMISFGEEVEWKKEIDWKKVNEIRQKEKERSLGLLKEVLK